jgi:hypothetical protein
MKLQSTEKLLVPFVQMFFWAALAAVFLHGFGFTSVSGAERYWLCLWGYCSTCSEVASLRLWIANT